MPPLSTHFRFSCLIVPRLAAASHVDLFLLGTVAPDAFRPADDASFAEHHFSREGGRIDLASFRKAARLGTLPAASPASAFATGYYAHLWLDAFFIDHGNELPVARSVSASQADLRLAVRKEAEFFNAPFVLALAGASRPTTEELSLPRGLEFIDKEACARLMRTVVEEAHAAALAAIVPTVLDEGQYDEFLGTGAESFLAERRCPSREGA